MVDLAVLFDNHISSEPGGVSAGSQGGSTHPATPQRVIGRNFCEGSEDMGDHVQPQLQTQPDPSESFFFSLGCIQHQGSLLIIAGVLAR